METERTKLFDMAIASSYAYYRNKDFEKAFVEIRRASLLINNPTEQGDYLGKLMTVNGHSALICIDEPKPKYDLVIIYFLTEFALDVARDLTSFPHLYPFYYRKKNQFSPDNGDDEDDWLNLSLKKLNILKHKKAILLEYKNFIYNELPIIYGIPIKYGEDSLSKILHSLNKDEFWDLMKFSEELTNKDISIIPYKCHDFVSKLLQEYYDLDNQR